MLQRMFADRSLKSTASTSISLESTCLMSSVEKDVDAW